MTVRVLVIGAIVVGCSQAVAEVEPSRAAPVPAPATTASMSASDVRSSGAKGDGVSDDTAAIQAACSRGDVFLSPGTYLVSRPLLVSGRVRIQGAGATIVSNEPSGALFRASGDLADFVVRDVVLRSARKDSEKRGEALLAVDYHSVNGLLLENVTLDTGPSYQNAISLAAEAATHIENVTIRDCSFTGTSAGIEIVHHVDAAPRITGIKILYNRFVHNGVKDDQNAGFAISLSGPLSRVNVTGNEIRGYPYAGIEIVASKSGGFEADYLIQANTIVGTGRGIITDTGHAGPSGRISHVSITGNLVIGNRFFQRLQGLADSVVEANIFDTRHSNASPEHQYDFFSLYDCDAILIANNSFRLELPAGEAGKAFVAFLGLRNSHVSGNQFDCSGVHAVGVGSPEKPSTDNSLFGNRFVQRDNGVFSDPVAFRGSGTTRNSLAASVIVKRHANTLASQARGNMSSGTVTVRSDTGAVGSSTDTLEIPSSENTRR